MSSNKQNANLRAAVVTCNFWPENIAMAIRMRYLVDALIRHGFATTVYTSARVKTDMNIQRVVNRLPPPSNMDVLFVRLLKEVSYGVETFLRLLFSNHDVYIVTSPPFVASAIASVALWLKNKAFVFDVRDEYPEVFFSEEILSPRGLPGMALLSLEKFLYNKAFMVTTVTSNIVEKIRKKSLAPDKVVLFRNGYARNIVPSSSLDKSVFKVVFHGNLGKFQNPELICEVAERCLRVGKKVQFEIYGWGNNIDTIKNREIANLRYFGEVKHDQIASYISHVQLGISFQKNGEISKNSFPSKVLEFIGAGIPVLITPKSEAGDFVEKNGLGYQFDADDADGVYEGLLKIYEDESLWRSMRNNAMNVREKLSRDYLSSEFVSRLKEKLSE